MKFVVVVVALVSLSISTPIYLSLGLADKEFFSARFRAAELTEYLDDHHILMTQIKVSQFYGKTNPPKFNYPNGLLW